VGPPRSTRRSAWTSSSALCVALKSQGDSLRNGGKLWSLDRELERAWRQLRIGSGELCFLSLWGDTGGAGCAERQSSDDRMRGPRTYRSPFIERKNPWASFRFDVPRLDARLPPVGQGLLTSLTRQAARMLPSMASPLSCVWPQTRWGLSHHLYPLTFWAASYRPQHERRSLYKTPALP